MALGPSRPALSLSSCFVSPAGSLSSTSWTARVPHPTLLCWGACQAGPSPSKTLFGFAWTQWKGFFPVIFSSLRKSDSKLTKMALEQCFSTVFFIIAPQTPRSPLRHFLPDPPHHDVLIPQICLFMYYMHICTLYMKKYNFYQIGSNSTLTD